MEQHKKDMGTRKDLVFYRIQTAKADLRSARILLRQKNIREQIIGLIMLFFMPSMLFMR